MMAFFDVISEVGLGVPALTFQKLAGIYDTADVVRGGGFQVNIVIVVSFISKEKTGFCFRGNRIMNAV
jgi:hypothetical protein